MLSEKGKKYVEQYYLLGNAREAAKRAGYAETTSNQNAYRWIGSSRKESERPDMWDYLQQLREADENLYNVTKGKVLQGMHRIANFDPRNLVDDFGDPIPINELDDDTAGAIAGIELEEKSITVDTTEKGEIRITKTRVKKYKIADRNPAWANIAKMLGYNAPDVTKHEAGESFLDLLKQTSVNASGSSTEKD